MNEARIVALFALSAGPAACARLAWVPAGGRPGLSLLGLTLLLGFATVVGESLEGRLPLSFRGGPLAAVAVVSFSAGLGLFLGLDHFTRRLAGRDSFSTSLHGIALRETLAAIAPPLGALILFFAAAPPSPHLGISGTDLDALLKRDEMASAYLQLALFCVSGAALIYYVTRMLRQRRRGREPSIEDVAVERGAEELIPERRSRPTRQAPGARGSIGRAYARFLAAANGLVFVRRIDQTPDEIASLVRSPGATLSRLTSLFRDARYGHREPTSADATEADSLADSLLAWLRSRSAPPSKRY